MRQWILLCFLLSNCFAVVSSGKNANAKNLNLESSVLSFHLVPAAPKVGEKATLFVQASTSISRNEYVLEATLDDSPLKFTSTGDLLWSSLMKTFSEVKSHTVTVNVFVRDSVEATRIISAINQLKRELNSLDAAIDAEPDLNKKAVLQNERDQKQAYSDELDVNLDSLKSFLKGESFDFVVNPDANNSNYPIITGVSPNASPLAKRIRVTITGNNFGINPNVKFGGQNSKIISASPSSIEVLAPNFSISGAKNIEITFPPADSEPRKNAILANSFFAADRAILKNLKPVVVTTGYVKATWPIAAPVALQAGNSYDENGDNFSYEWTFQKVPAGSVFSGAVLSNSATPSFTPDKVGIYTIKLKLNETSTEELLSSFVNTVTVEVK